MSDTVSVSSNMSGDNAIGGILVEEVGNLSLSQQGEFIPKKMVLLNYTLAAISEEGKLLLGELRTRGGDDWTLAGKSLRDLPADRKYLDLALVPNVQHGQGGASLVFLVEKKNKERCITAHNIRHGKSLVLEEEFSCYDKVNVLGKGVSNIVADTNATEPTVYSASNLVRKLRLEDGGTNLKPTPARAQVPAEGQDGTLAMAVQPLGSGKSTSHQSLVVMSFRTKSATKNKFMIEWYLSKKDELSCTKQAVKMGEDCEPGVLLADPKDSRNVYALCRNKSNSTTALYKLTKGRRHDEPIIVLNYEVELAALGMSADQNVTLVAYDMNNDVTRIYTLQKTEGFRGKHPICAHCPPLEALSSPSHIISCATHRWQLPIGLVDMLFAGPRFQMSLVTLLDASGRYVTEPEGGNPYRLRVLGCDTQGFSPLAILLEDLERTFDNAEEKLSTATLKICINLSPCRDSQSQLSAWLMSGRLSSVEVQYVKAGAGEGALSGSDRLTFKPISAERFRSFVTDMDWTQMNQRQGTFTLDQSDAGVSPAPSMTASVCSTPHASAGKTRIPVSRIPSANLSSSHHSGLNGSFHAQQQQPHPRSVSRENGLDVSMTSCSSRSGGSSGPESENEMRGMMRGLSEALSKVLADNEAMRSDLETLSRSVREVQGVVDGRGEE